MSEGLRLYNTLTRSKEPFVPLDPDNVRMYVCGPTVYDFAHIGNARPAIVFDVLFRLLRHVYGPDHVTYVRNITDVDDKINARALRDFGEDIEAGRLTLNEAIRKVTEKTADQFDADVKALGCLEPSDEPRATEYIPEMRALIDRLVERGVAYVAEDHVLFSPKAMNARPGPRYGSLSKRPFDEMLAGARVDVASYKRDEMDFVLWKPSKPGEPGWPSPAGIPVDGRPGWHIECSAMSMAKLLAPFGGGLACDDPTKNMFDIHGGGIDLVFPHHENEVAQSCCALGTDRMASIWIHNGFVQVEGRKMSKSEGNFVTIHDLLHTDKFGGRKWPGEVLRLAMLMTHYREPIDFSVRKLEEAENILTRWYRLLSEMPGVEPSSPRDSLISALNDELDTSGAIKKIYSMFSSSQTGRLELGISELGWDFYNPVCASIALASAQLMGLLMLNPSEWLQGKSGLKSTDVEVFIQRRLALIAQKNWAEADRIRDELLAQGIQLKDGKDPVTGERITTWEVKR
ncbi:cysteine--tRNA ligase [Aquibium carbonis]|uniref:Cysteine--tRNA ligase n=1 Tax=Aquibium carbonis TaxID=2495581 RepID=A0A429YWU8_9HYPH|nr:cysteine--tRNA ligase [Aquibium carbonis]RST85944.1 cysteine--tRNA ligase [Aquibium carbonis]